jgi:hypothetical protein
MLGGFMTRQTVMQNDCQKILTQWWRGFVPPNGPLFLWGARFIDGRFGAKRFSTFGGIEDNALNLYSMNRLAWNCIWFFPSPPWGHAIFGPLLPSFSFTLRPNPRV